jgi:hypothetical protein
MNLNFIKYPSDDDWLIARNNALTTQRKRSRMTPSRIYLGVD